MYYLGVKEMFWQFPDNFFLLPFKFTEKNKHILFQVNTTFFFFFLFSQVRQTKSQLVHNSKPDANKKPFH